LATLLYSKAAVAFFLAATQEGNHAPMACTLVKREGKGDG
jgi:hypothetical protein